MNTFNRVISLGEHTFLFRPFQPHDADNLLGYLNNLSQESRERFGPHPYNTDSLLDLSHSDDYQLLLAIDINTTYIAAYTVVKLGWLDFEKKRYQSYKKTAKPGDCTLAPSVADYWQSKGLGSRFLSYTLDFLKAKHHIKRIFLWGGVQIDNVKAIGFYKKNNFKDIGQFEHNGRNIDMILTISS
jgi:GNAT superfamily N-acetyltransferase